MPDPRLEAEARLDGRYSVRVLEPSPPAVATGPYFADDPAVRADAPPDGRPVVTPTTEGDLTWADIAGSDGELAAWAAERWLGPWLRLEPLPASFVATRAAWHRLAVYVVAPARRAVNGKIGLRYTHRGFGTPFFGPDRQVRVAGVDLVVTEGDRDGHRPISTLHAAAVAAAVDLVDDPGVGDDLPAMGDPGADLGIDHRGAVALDRLFGFASSVLEEFRWELRQAEVEVSRVQLWPEHFDLAFDDGWATYGASPGDEAHPDPYLYVGPWDRTALAGDSYWNAPFGARLPYDDLLAAPDQRADAVAFLRHGRELRPG